MKTKMKFSDIAGMLERDEMKEIFGGCGNACGSNISAGGDMTFATFMGFGGGNAIGSTFGGQLFSSFGNSTSSGGGGSTSGNGSFTTSDPNQIKQILAMLTGNFGNLPPGVLSTPIPGTTDTFLGEKLREVIVGNKNSTAQTLGAVAFGWDIKTILSQLAVGGDAAGDFAAYFKFLELGSNAALGASAGLTVYNAFNNGGFEDYHVADLGTQAIIYGAASAVPVAGWALGAAYFLGNYYTEKNYGQGLYEHLSPN